MAGVMLELPRGFMPIVFQIEEDHHIEFVEKIHKRFEKNAHIKLQK